MQVAIIYYSGTGNTEAIASLIAEGVRKAGSSADVLPVGQCQIAVLDSYDKFAFGCPAMGEEELDDMEFLPFFEQVETKLAGHEIALFGSFGWGDGQWMRNWEERVKAKGIAVFEQGLAIFEEPGSESESCRDFGRRFVTES